MNADDPTLEMKHGLECEAFRELYPHAWLDFKVCKCYIKHLPIAKSAKLLVYGYLNDGSYRIRVTEQFLKMPIYNIPVQNHEHQGPIRTIRELNFPARYALALNGLNHTNEGMLAIRKWVIDESGRPDGRPDDLLVFQPMFGSHVSTMFERGHEFGSIPDTRKWDACLSLNHPEKRVLFLSAFDALNLVSDHCYSECNHRDSDVVPHPSNVDVMFVHHLDATVIINTSTLNITQRYRSAQSKVFSDQVLFHKVVASTIVYIGGISSGDCPIGSNSSLDFVRLIVVKTSAVQ